MTSDLSDLILRLLSEHRIMTIATNRFDGWPQATLVGYVNDGLILYCFVARTSQKYINIKRDSRVSLTIGGDFSDPLQIKPSRSRRRQAWSTIEPSSIASAMRS